MRARRCTRTSTSSSSRPKPIAAAEQEDLLNETYALYLECGRQLSPHFLSEARLAAPDDERTREFLERIAGETLVAWPPR